MTKQNLLHLLLCMVVIAMAACSPTPSLHGNWSLDIDATVQNAKAAGVPHSVASRVLEFYGGGKLEITSDTLVMRVTGVPAITSNYKVVGEADNCYKLEIDGESGVHTYCVEGSHLMVKDPEASFVFVYKDA